MNDDHDHAAAVPAAKPADARRIGVVLSGGGLRGSYQAGFLKGLEASGVSVCAVSGSSVGALNALAFSRMGADGLLRLWTFPHDQTPVKIRVIATAKVLSATSVMLLCYWPALVWFSIVRMIRIVRRRVETEEGVWYRLLESIYCTKYPAQAVGYRLSGEYSLTHLPTFMYFFVASALLLPRMSDDNYIGFAEIAPVFVITVAVGILNTSQVPNRVYASVVGQRAELADVRILRSALSEISALRVEDNAIPKVRTFVCISEMVDAFDWRTFKSLGVRSGFAAGPMIGDGHNADFYWDKLRSITNGNASVYRCQRILPTYLEISSFTPDKAAITCARSAALPFGILDGGAHGADGSSRYFDGGVTDNAPVLPLTRLSLDRIVVVDIGSRPAATSKSRLRDLAYLESMGTPKNAQIFEMERRVLHRRNATGRCGRCTHTRLARFLELDPSLVPPAVEVVTVRPSAHSVGLLRGSASSIARLAAVGESDGRSWAMDFLRENEGPERTPLG